MPFAYSQRSFLFDQSKHKNLVVIARVRSNRIFYQSPSVDESKKKRGCPKKYGERFNLIVTPSVVQRDFQRIISEIGTPAHSPKTRGNSIGRVQGQTQTQRTKHPVIKKQSKSTPDKEKAA